MERRLISKLNQSSSDEEEEDVGNLSIEEQIRLQRELQNENNITSPPLSRLAPMDVYHTAPSTRSATPNEDKGFEAFMQTLQQELQTAESSDETLEMKKIVSTSGVIQTENLLSNRKEMLQQILDQMLNHPQLEPEYRQRLSSVLENATDLESSINLLYAFYEEIKEEKMKEVEQAAEALRLQDEVIQNQTTQIQDLGQSVTDLSSKQNTLKDEVENLESSMAQLNIEHYHGLEQQVIETNRLTQQVIDIENNLSVANENTNIVENAVRTNLQGQLNIEQAQSDQLREVNERLKRQMELQQRQIRQMINAEAVRRYRDLQQRQRQQVREASESPLPPPRVDQDPIITFVHDSILTIGLIGGGLLSLVLLIGLDYENPGHRSAIFAQFGREFTRDWFHLQQTIVTIAGRMGILFQSLPLYIQSLIFTNPEHVIERFTTIVDYSYINPLPYIALTRGLDWLGNFTDYNLARLSRKILNGKYSRHVGDYLSISENLAYIREQFDLLGIIPERIGFSGRRKEFIENMEIAVFSRNDIRLASETNPEANVNNYIAAGAMGFIEGLALTYTTGIPYAAMTTMLQRVITTVSHTQVVDKYMNVDTAIQILKSTPTEQLPEIVSSLPVLWVNAAISVLFEVLGLGESPQGESLPWSLLVAQITYAFSSRLIFIGIIYIVVVMGIRRSARFARIENQFNQVQDILTDVTELRFVYAVVAMSVMMDYLDTLSPFQRELIVRYYLYSVAHRVIGKRW